MVAGEVLACKWVRLACQRHLDDRKREKDPSWPYRFDRVKGERVCRFLEALPHVKGEWAAARKSFTLEPFQSFITCSLFGWVEKQSGNYRFSEAYIEVPRKNGKSIWAAGVGHYKFSADGEFGAEVYSGATTEKQAWEVFRPAKWMAERTPDLRESFGITVNAKSLTIEANGSRYEPIIGKPGDGASPSCAIVDEYHEHLSDELVETMRTGMGARRNPLLLKITTAGSDRSSPCYATHSDAKKLLEGKRKNDNLFAIIYTIDEGDDWKSEQSLVKANPNFNVSVFADFLKREQLQAVETARLQNAFKTKHLNVWVNASIAWMNMEKWDRAADPKLSIEEFEGQECYIGLDLASEVDLAAKVRLFRRLQEDEDGARFHYYVFATHYLNQTAVDDAKNDHYSGWAADGKLVVTPGDSTDYTWIADDLVEDANHFIVREVVHDPYHAAPLMQFVQKRNDWPSNIESVAIRQTPANMSAPMKKLEALVLEGRLHHNGDECLAWQMSNTLCDMHKHDVIMPDKERAENKIDAPVSMIMALGAWELRGGGASVYESRGLITL